MNKKLEEILNNIRKKYGQGAIMEGNDTISQTEVISTSCLSLDKALGVGGFPKGRIVEIHGQESVGKSTLAAHVIAEAQRLGGICAYIDVEHAVDSAYFEKIGVDTSSEGGKYLLSQPTCGEEAINILEMLLETGEVAVVVIDSVAALVTQAELDGEVEDSTIALQARLMSKCMRRITSLVNKSNTCVIFINQLRENIGGYGNSAKWVTPGGKALKFYASVRIELSRIGQVKEGDSVVGSRIKAKIVKNKVASPFKEAEFEVAYGEGILIDKDLIELGIKQNLIKKGGSWLTYNKANGEDIKFQSMEKFRLFLKENLDVRNELYDRLTNPDGLQVKNASSTD